ncbi:peptidyl-prolyl cis-trans isomerase [Odoribacter lunatus]|uniref:peptidyl-prolyl cis-trans isomerase n=1 Tax=Odoribacter lunatus TaxID=2941335 RepID=UPI00203CEF85|nr:peptidyl-prolyl cis-trans isomerase [Odoribacter lunatus]
MKIILFISFLLLLFSCDYLIRPNKDEVVARVFDSELLRSEINTSILSKTNKDDSILMAKNYIRNWVTKQLLLQKAMNNLTEEEKDIDKQVEDYRSAILIHLYKQKLINQKLSKEIENEKIEKYYQENKINFILPTPIVKATFFILPKTAPHIEQIRKWFKSNDVHDWGYIEDYCITHAKKYDNFSNKWVELKFIFNLLPGDVTKLENEIRQIKNIEKSDEENYYFLKISEICKEQNIAPLDYVRDEITLILKNKKKIQFETQLEKEINEEAEQKNYVKIY